MAEIKTVLVCGATGKQGGALVRRKLTPQILSAKQTYRVLALTRDASSAKARALAALPSVEVVTGDATRPASLFAHGAVDAMFLLVPSTTPDELEHTKAIGDLAAAHGVRYIVYSGVDLSGVPDTHVPSFEVKRRAYAHLAALPLRTTHLAPASFMENYLFPAQAASTRAWPDGYAHKLVSTADIALAAAAMIADPARWAGRQVELASDATTAAQFRQVWEDVVGPLPRAELPPSMQRVMDVLFTHLYAHPFVADPAQCHRDFPGMTTFRAWLETVCKPALAAQAKPAA